MSNVFVKFSIVVIALLLFRYQSISQDLVADSSIAGYKSAVTYYNNSLLEELHLFNGGESKDYTYSFSEGMPYFITNNWSAGNVNYDGKLYENVSILYDVVMDQLICLYFNKISRVTLLKEKVSGFSVLGHSFIHLKPEDLHSSSLTPGFYDQLYKGKISLFARRTKNIQTSFKQTGAERKVFSKNEYFIHKENEYYTVRNKRSFLGSLTDKKKELQQYIRQNRLNFRKDPENTMTKTIAYYNQLVNK